MPAADARLQLSLAKIRNRPFNFGNPMDGQNLCTNESLQADLQRIVSANPDQLARHIAVMGVSGSGKSKFLELLCRHLINGLNGFTFIDPHGDTAEALLAYLAKEKGDAFLDRIHYLQPTSQTTFAFDPFASLILDDPDLSFEDRRHATVQYMIGVLMRSTASADADVMKRLKKNLTTFLTVIATPLPNGKRFSLADIDVFLSRHHERHQDAVRLLRDHYPRAVRQDFDDLFVLPPARFFDEVSSTVNLVRTFLSPISEQVFGLQAQGIDFKKVLADREMVIVNLKPTGSVHRESTKPIAGFIIRELMTFAQSVPEEQRVPHNLIVDEAGQYVAEDFIHMLQECRKHKLSLCLGGQTMQSFQVGDSLDVGKSLLSQCKTVIGFQQKEPEDVELLSRFFATPNLDLYQRFQPMQVDAPHLDQIILLNSQGYTTSRQESRAQTQMHGTSDGDGITVSRAEGIASSNVRSVHHSDSRSTSENQGAGSGYSEGKANYSSRSDGVQYQDPSGFALGIPSINVASGATESFSNNQSYFASQGTTQGSSDGHGHAHADQQSQMQGRAEARMHGRTEGRAFAEGQTSGFSETHNTSEHLRPGTEIKWVATGQPLYAIPYQNALYERALSTMPQQFAFVRSQLTGIEQTIIVRIHDMPTIQIDRKEIDRYLEKLFDRKPYIFMKTMDADSAQANRLEKIFASESTSDGRKGTVSDEGESSLPGESKDPDPFFGDD